MEKHYQIYISSTYGDLKDERQRLKEALFQMNCFPIGIELTAVSEDGLETAKGLIKGCDYFILLLGGKYGDIYEPSGKSYTQLEYEYAQDCGIPSISFIRADLSILPENKSEDSQKTKDKLSKFAEILYAHNHKAWKTMEDLLSMAPLAIMNLVRSMPRVGWVRANSAGLVEDAREILRLVRELDELKTELKDIDKRELSDASNLQQGDDILEIGYSYKYGYDLYKETSKLTWSEIFAFLLPLCNSSNPEENLKKSFTDFIKEQSGGGGYDFTVQENSFQQIKVQMLALGFIEHRSDFWLLTSVGEHTMFELLALRRN